MRKKSLRKLLIAIFIFMCAFAITGNVKAQTLTVRDKPVSFSVSGYGVSGMHKWTMSNGVTAYCFKSGAYTPPKGMKFSCTTYTGAKGRGVLYIFDYYTGKTGNEDFAVRQAGIWCYLNGSCSRGNATLQSRAKALRDYVMILKE